MWTKFQVRNPKIGAIACNIARNWEMICAAFVFLLNYVNALECVNLCTIFASVKVLPNHRNRHNIPQPIRHHVLPLHLLLAAGGGHHAGAVLPPVGHAAVAHVRVLPHPGHAELPVLAVVHKLQRQGAGRQGPGPEPAQRAGVAGPGRKTVRVQGPLGGPLAHDAAAGQGLQRHVRHVLHPDPADDDRRQLRLPHGNPGPRHLLQGGRLVPHRVLLHVAAVHHLQRGALRLGEDGAGVQGAAAERELIRRRHQDEAGGSHVLDGHQQEPAGHELEPVHEHQQEVDIHGECSN